MTLITLLDGTKEVGNNSYGSYLEEAFFEVNKYTELIPNVSPGSYDSDSYDLFKSIESEVERKSAKKEDGFGKQLSFYKYINILNKRNSLVIEDEKSYYNPLGNYVFILTEKDLCDGNSNQKYLLGGSMEVQTGTFNNNRRIFSKVNYTILSTARLPKKELLTDLAIHELGHVLGASSIGRKKTHNGYENHCSNKCIMRDCSSLESLIKTSKKISKKNFKFCPMCEKELRNSKDFVN